MLHGTGRQIGGGMEDTHQQTTNFLALISDKAIERLSPEELESPIKMQIVGLMYALKFDFSERFMKQFKNADDVQMYKQKMYSELDGVRINAIYGGYRAFCEENSKKEYIDIGQHKIVAYIKDFNEKLRREEESAKETERISALPPPTVTIEPEQITQMFADAKNKSANLGQADRDAMIQNHYAILILKSHLIRRPKFNEEHNCEYSGCRKLGALARSTTGGGNFYCLEHYKLT